MREQHVKQTLHEIAEQAVPADLDLWPTIRGSLHARSGKQMTFRRLGMVLVGTVALALVFLFGLPLLNSNQELPLLPSLSALSAQAQGGGLSTVGVGLSPIPEAEFVLDTTLPSAPERTTVFRRPARPSLTPADAQRLASRFGLEGPVYTEQRPLSPHITKQLDSPSRPAYYFVFGERHTMRVESSGGFSYFDNNEQFVPDTTADLSFEQAAAIAEEFLQTRGLLDFPYQVEQGHEPGTVLFQYLVDGRKVRNATEGVHVAGGVGSNGQVQWVTYKPPDLESLAAYPIRTAQEAWEALRSHQSSRWVQYAIDPAEGAIGPVTRWRREYRPGQEAHLYGSPIVYHPIENDQLPLVKMKSLWLRGPQDEIQSLGEKQNNRLHVWGQVQQEPSGGRGLNLAGWEVLLSVPAPSDPDFQGTIERAAGRVLLHLEDGAVFVLLDPPDELRDGQVVSGQGWETKRQIGGYSVLEWTTLQPFPATRVPIVQMQGPSFSVELSREQAQAPSEPGRIIIERVELIYYALPDYVLWDVPADSPMRIVQPMWRFAGHTEDDTAVEVLVQAVRDEYLQGPGQ